MADYPKYQWSYFVNGDRNSQIVVRADDSVELQNAITKVLPIIGNVKKIEKVEKEHDVAVTQPVLDNLEGFCPVHNVKLQQAISKKTGNPYFYHRDNGKMCFGKGYTS